MGQHTSSKKPWLAAGLTLLVTGLGQVYLRRWGRALGWLALALLVGGLFVPDAVLANPSSATFWDAAPILVVGVLSVLDAYVLARQHNVHLAVQRAERCSDCYRELEDDVTFCPWCGTDAPTASESPESGDSSADALDDDQYR